jgi:hypothetical protein
MIERSSSILVLGIQNDFADHVEPDGRRIQVVEGAQPFLLAGLFGARQALGDQLVGQVQRVILGHGLEGVCKSHQRGEAAFGRHARDAGRPGRGRIAGQGLDAPRGHAGHF